MRRLRPQDGTAVDATEIALENVFRDIDADLGKLDRDNPGLNAQLSVFPHGYGEIIDPENEARSSAVRSPAPPYSGRSFTCSPISWIWSMSAGVLPGRGKRGRHERQAHGGQAHGGQAGIRSASRAEPPS
jgi:hypothetical protein